MISLKKMASLTALLAFIMVLFSSIVLYIVPQGRVAYWTDWQLLGLTKTQWDAIHINMGILLILSLVIHLYYNWRLIVSYLKKQRKLTLFTREFTLALVISLIWLVGTYARIPPFSTILEISDHIKSSAAREYGEPPYGHAEQSTLTSLATKMDLNTHDALAQLKAAGYQVENSRQTLRELADLNRVSPQTLYQAMLSSTNPSQIASSLPKKPHPGIGRQTLAGFCQHYHLDPVKVLHQLKLAHIDATTEMTFRQISDHNGIGIHELYKQIRAATTSSDPDIPHSSPESPHP